MLIVNADDLGRNKTATDRTLTCHKLNRITSTSAMVFMEDSERAAQLAIASGIDVGLHINLSEKFTANAIPEQLRKSHNQICGFLTTNKYALLVYHPFLRSQFREVFEAQLAEFLRLYEREPSHLDGHQHMHLSSNLLIDRILPSETKVRRSFSFAAGEKSIVNRVYRSAVDRCLKRRHILTDYFFALPHNMSPERLGIIIRLAKQFNVELMTHPELHLDYNFLLGDSFGQAISQVRLSGYDFL